MYSFEEVDESPEQASVEDHAPDIGCEECGHTWYSGWTRATRYDPAEPLQPDCPVCSR